ncbi:MAG TPA: MFS transporter [Caulobacteraceae bacterium]|nr:MFS transporter [Caulobacteraceae bacterium]
MSGQANRLWGHRDFLRLWGAQAVSSFGARIAREGLPIAAVITLKAGPQAIGLFAALTLAAQAAVGLFAGALADRLPKRRLLIAADVARALVLAAIPLAALAGRLTLVEIYLAAVLLGAANVVFDVADHAYLPSLVDRADLTEANAKLSATEAVAEVGGPALTGVLVGVIAPPLAVGLNAITYLASALMLGRIRGGARSPAPDAAPAEPPRLDLTAGLRLVLAHPLVRPLWLADVGKSFFGYFFAALYILLALNVLKLTTPMLGLTIAMGGIGGLAGAALAPWLTRRLGPGRMILASGLAGGATLFLIPLAAGPPLVAMAILAAAQLIGDALQTTAGIGSATLRQTILPPEQLGRAGGAFATGAAAAGVAGALTGGALGAAMGPRETLLIAAAGVTAASLFVLFSPLRNLTRDPAADAAL